MPFLPKQRIGEARNVGHVDAAADDPPTLLHCLERQRNKGAHRCKDDGGVERLGRHLVGAAGPDRPQRPRKCLRRRVVAAGEGIDATTLPGRDLSKDVRSRAEAVQAKRIQTFPFKPCALLRSPLRGSDAIAAPADQPGAEERRDLGVIPPLGQRKAIARIGERVCRVAAIAGESCKQRPIAQIFPPGTTI
jgi:hypothetical protein